MSNLGHGLHKMDEQILRSLTKSPAHPSGLARTMGLPRTTIAYRLLKLERRKLVKNKVVGRRVLWELLFPEAKQTTDIRTYREDDIISAYSLLFSLPRESIIYCVQGGNAVRGELEALPPMFIKKAHAVFKRKRIIIIGASNRIALEHTSNLDEDLIRSHIGRTVGVSLFRDLFQGDGELFVTKNFVLLACPNKKLAVVIYNRGIVSIMLDVCKVFFDLLDGDRKFDVNKYFRDILLEHGKPS